MVNSRQVFHLGPLFRVRPFLGLSLFSAINRADIQDTDMEAIMDTIVDSLFCFFVTLGQSSSVFVSDVDRFSQNLSQKQVPGWSFYAAL